MTSMPAVALGVPESSNCWMSTPRARLPSLELQTPARHVDHDALGYGGLPQQSFHSRLLLGLGRRV